jgi:uncharacterized protein YjaG (DUF416 family)
VKDIEYEIECLKTYLNIVMLLKKRNESKTSLEEDLKILDET